MSHVLPQTSQLAIPRQIVTRVGEDSPQKGHFGMSVRRGAIRVSRERGVTRLERRRAPRLLDDGMAGEPVRIDGQGLRTRIHERRCDFRARRHRDAWILLL